MFRYADFSIFEGLWGQSCGHGANNNSFKSYTRCSFGPGDVLNLGDIKRKNGRFLKNGIYHNRTLHYDKAHNIWGK